jgi:TonB family protein
MHLKIKEPCPANWDEMTSVKDGKFCAMCEKNVIDFTEKSKSDILIYMLENKEKNICAKMPFRELNFNYNDITNAKWTYDQSPFKSKVIQWSLISLLLASCNDNEHKPTIEKDSKPEETYQPLGKIMPLNDTIKKSKFSKVSKSNASSITICNTDQLGEIIWDEPEENKIVEDEEQMPILGAIALSNDETQPEFPGGEIALNQFINSNLTYPPSEIENGKEGIVYASFLVREDGTITDIKIIKSLNKETFDKQVISLIEKMPKWKPGKKLKVAVKSTMLLPFKFELK